MDTGSSDLFLASTLCTDCSLSIHSICFLNNRSQIYYIAGMKPFYNPKSSTSYVNTGTSVELNYGSGCANVTLVNDVVCIGTFCYKSQVISSPFFAYLSLTFSYTFGMATFVGADPNDIGTCSNGSNSFQNSGFSGLLGLAWPSISVATPFIQNILTQLQQPLFTIWLNRWVKEIVRSPTLSLVQHRYHVDNRRNYVRRWHNVWWSGYDALQLNGDLRPVVIGYVLAVCDERVIFYS